MMYNNRKFSSLNGPSTWVPNAHNNYSRVPASTNANTVNFQPTTSYGDSTSGRRARRPNRKRGKAPKKVQNTEITEHASPAPEPVLPIPGSITHTSPKNYRDPPPLTPDGRVIGRRSYAYVMEPPLSKEAEEELYNNAEYGSEPEIYSPFFADDYMQSCVKNGKLIAGFLRTNPKDSRCSYVRHPLGDSDILIHGLTAKNRCLPTDYVVVELKPKKEWRVLLRSNDDVIDRSSYPELGPYVEKHREELIELLGLAAVQELEYDIERPDDPELPAPADRPVVPWWSIMQRTGHVVGLFRKMHPRILMGCLDVGTVMNFQMRNRRLRYIMLTPLDRRLPRVSIHPSDCPKDLLDNPRRYAGARFLCQLYHWTLTELMPTGTLVRVFSNTDSDVIHNETDRILITAGFVGGLDHTDDFPGVDNAFGSNGSEYKSISDSEIKFRKDFRDQCVFTIDPSTARDLDDALHVRALTRKEVEDLSSKGYLDAAYEVGIHISDVSHYVRPNTPIDTEASCRATSIYLVQLCVPMLPRTLCEHLCSLNPGEDKLSFSVILHVNSKGKILTTWFGRTLIRSCAQLSYDDAQSMIDTPLNELNPDLLPRIQKPHKLEDVYESVQILNNLAVEMRKDRFLNGCLRLDQVKLHFKLDSNTGMPIGMAPQLHLQSNRLVEEFMLAANQAVAIHLQKHLPHLAFLRRHSPPTDKQLQDAASGLSSIGVSINTDSASAIQSSLCQEAMCSLETGYRFSENLATICTEMSMLSLDGENNSPVKPGSPHSIGDTEHLSQTPKDLVHREARLLAITSHLVKIMNLAEYFCVPLLPERATTEHYALNMTYYTHFTSPIRRYADVIVHRQLASILSEEARKNGRGDIAQWYGKTALPADVTAEMLQSQADLCNIKKLNARQASDESMELFFGLFVKEAGTINEVCVVLGVLDESFDVLLLSCGLKQRIFMNNLKVKSFEYNDMRKCDNNRFIATGKLCVFWREPGRYVSVGDDTVWHSDTPDCGCFYTEIKPMDVIVCQVSTDPKSDPSVMPKLLLEMSRPTCLRCSHLD